jgi:hypothetical protein
VPNPFDTGIRMTVVNPEPTRVRCDVKETEAMKTDEMPPEVGELIEAYMDEDSEPMLKMDGFNDCIAGVCLRFGQQPIVIYDKAKVIAKLVADGCGSEEEAEEFWSFNQIGSWVGNGTPAFLVTP